MNYFAPLNYMYHSSSSSSSSSSCSFLFLLLLPLSSSSSSSSSSFSSSSSSSFTQSEALFLYGIMLLVIDMKFEGNVRERMLVAFHLHRCVYMYSTYRACNVYKNVL